MSMDGRHVLFLKQSSLKNFAKSSETILAFASYVNQADWDDNFLVRTFAANTDPASIQTDSGKRIAGFPTLHYLDSKSGQLLIYEAVDCVKKVEELCAFLIAERNKRARKMQDVDERFRKSAPLDRANRKGEDQGDGPRGVVFTEDLYHVKHRQGRATEPGVISDTEIRTIGGGDKLTDDAIQAMMRAREDADRAIDRQMGVDRDYDDGGNNQQAPTHHHYRSRGGASNRPF